MVPNGVMTCPLSGTRWGKDGDEGISMGRARFSNRIVGWTTDFVPEALGLPGPFFRGEGARGSEDTVEYRDCMYVARRTWKCGSRPSKELMGSFGVSPCSVPSLNEKLGVRFLFVVDVYVFRPCKAPFSCCFYKLDLDP
jgi:hypothetical protein